MANYVINIDCWKHTQEYCKNELKGIYPDKSIKYKYKNINIENKEYNTEIIVLNMDCIEVGLELKKKGYNPVILNLADYNFPGGCVDLGSGAQEESIFRRTNYFQTLNLETNFYPLNGTDIIYSPKVHIIKDTDLNYIYKIETLSFIAGPGLRNPYLTEENKINETDKNILKDKIRNILNISYKYNHIPVLGALGCGAWQNPPEEVAKIYKEVLEEYKGVFEKIIFSILENTKKNYILKYESNKSNYNIFLNILEKK
jgi:uncharacterized protein (TIGR02452 family)